MVDWPVWFIYSSLTLTSALRIKTFDLNVTFHRGIKVEWTPAIVQQNEPLQANGERTHAAEPGTKRKWACWCHVQTQIYMHDKHSLLHSTATATFNCLVFLTTVRPEGENGYETCQVIGLTMSAKAHRLCSNTSLHFQLWRNLDT